MIVVACGLAPCVAHAQSSGENVDECSSGYGIDPYSAVSESVCIYGNSTSLEADLNLGFGATGPVANAAGALEVDPFGTWYYDDYASYVFTPQINTWYTANGYYNECFDWSGNGSPSDCDWGSYSLGVSTSVQVTQAESLYLVSQNPQPTSYGSPVTFTISLYPQLSGAQVTLYDGSTVIGTATTSGGGATFATSALSAGVHSITASWAGNGTYGPITSSAVSQTVYAVTPNVSVSCSPNPIIYGTQPLNCTASVSGGATGTVQFYWNGNYWGNFSLSGGSAVLPALNTFVAGSYAVVANYSGDAGNNPASASTTLTVSKATPTVSVSCSPNPITYGGGNTTCTATVTPGATGSVSFYANGGGWTTVPLSGNTASATGWGGGSWAAGTYPVGVTYNGDGNYNAANGSTTITISKATPTVSVFCSPNPITYGGGNTTCTATVTPGATGSVSFYSNGGAWTTVPLSGNTASASGWGGYSWAAGTYPVGVTYNGDGNYNAASGSTTITINKGTPSISVSCSPNPIVYTNGTQTSTCTASVSNGATGTAAFYWNGNYWASPNLSGGNASLTGFNGLGAGSYSVAVNYSGDASNNPVSGSTTVTIDKATPTISVSCSPNPVVFNTGTTTCTASVNAPGSTADVAFTYDGSVNWANIPLSNGSAVSANIFTNAPAGSYPIVAAFAGDANYNAVSASTTYVVAPATPALRVETSNTPSTYGGSVAFTATISNGPPSGAVTFYDNGASIGTGSIGGTTATLTTSTLIAGTHSITAGWAGNTDYSAAASPPVTQTVNQATPIITWLTPAPMTYAAPTSTALPIQAGIITTLAGNRTSDFDTPPLMWGDGQAAPGAFLQNATGVAVDAWGNLYIADSGFNEIRGVKASTDIISTVAGTGYAAYLAPYETGGDGIAATGAGLSPYGVAVDTSGNFYIADIANSRVRKVTISTGVISTVAGIGQFPSTSGIGYSGDGGAAASAELNTPYGVAVDVSGSIYIADSSNNRIRKVTGGIITTVAGNGTQGFSGDGGPATNAELNFPTGVAVDGAGNIYIADSNNNRIRKVTAGVITTVAGGSAQGFSGDGGPATSAELYTACPTPGAPRYCWAGGGVAVDISGNLYIADTYNYRIRLVTVSDGMITTVAGNGVSGNPGSGPDIGDGGPATSAELSDPTGVSVDSSGNIYFADNNRIRVVGAPVGLSAVQLNATANVPGTFVYTPPAGTLLTVGSTLLSVLFTPTDSVDYTTATASVTQIVNLAVPALSFAPIPAQMYAVAPFQVNASSASTGAITYSVVSGPATLSGSTVTITGVGTVVLSASQAATADYAAGTATASFTVLPSLTFTPIAEQIYGASPFTVSASSASTGAITYSVVSGPAAVSGSTVTLTGVGTVVLAASQAATATSPAATASVSFTVIPATPRITWGPPAPITSGTALSSTQLNASASVAGTFSYSPALGTVLSSGLQLLTATFTPTNSADYAATSDIVAIMVNAAGTISDAGTLTLTVGGVVAATTNYGSGATPSSIAEGLAANMATGSNVNVTAVNDAIYIEAKPAYAGSDYSYTLQTTSWDSADFSQPSFVPSGVSGTLEGGASGGGPARQPVYSYSASYDGAGNVTGYIDSVMGTWSSISYDSLNRLTGAQNTAVTSTSTQYSGMYGCWSYDDFGNRTMEAISTTPCANNPLPTSWAHYTIDGTLNTGDNGKNQITGSPNGIYQYDSSGDVTYDGMNQYLYDGEGRICAMENMTVGVMTGYIYNADGTRVAKGTIQNMNSCDPAVNGFQTTNDYVLGPGGEQVSEMGMDAGGNMAWVHTNVWTSSKLLATYDNAGLHFYFNDPLGTRRAQTDYAGVPEQTCSSLPFGDSFNCTGSATSPTENHFTGKERDSESGLDYFGARYYASNMGRWLSPDWSSTPQAVPYADLKNPQSLNLYEYVGNNPLSKSDEDGHCTVDGENHGSVWCWFHDHGLFGVETAAERQADQVKEARNFINANGFDVINVNGHWQPSSKSSDSDVASWWKDYNQAYSDSVNNGNSPAAAMGLLAGITPGGGGGSRLTNSQSRDLAKWNGMEPVKDPPFDSHGQPVFQKDGKFYSPDADGHNGGVWKEFNRQGQRTGTYNYDLSVKIGK